MTAAEGGDALMRGRSSGSAWRRRSSGGGGSATAGDDGRRRQHARSKQCWMRGVVRAAVRRGAAVTWTGDRERG